MDPRFPQQQNLRLVHAAAPHLAMAPRAIGGAHHGAYAACLTDADGALLDVVPAGDLNDGEPRPGIRSSVACASSEAAAIAIACGRAMLVVGEERAGAADGRLTCAAAPVRAGDGSIVGAVGVGGPTVLMHPQSLILVESVARRIEGDLRVPYAPVHRGRQARDGISAAALSMVLHEIRQPLASLVNVAELLAGEVEAAPLKPAVEMLWSAVEEMTRLTEDLGDMTCLAFGGTVRLRRDPCDLTALLQRLASDRAAGFRKRQQHLTTQLPAAGVWLTADARRLRQVFGNLIDNASKYTPAGGQVLLSLREERTHALVEVRDSGCGIAPEDQVAIFDLFRQGSQRRGGLGVGLFLVRRLVELHGGAVEVSSDGAGKGSLFTVRLPLRPPCSDAPVRPGPRASPAFTPPERRCPRGSRSA